MAKANTIAPPAEVKKKQDLAKDIESAVGDDLEWPDDEALPPAHEPPAEKKKAAAVPPPEDEGQDEDEGLEEDEEAGAEGDGEDLEDEEDENLSPQDKAINDLRKTVEKQAETIKSMGTGEAAKERRTKQRTQVEESLTQWDTAFDTEITKSNKRLKEIREEKARLIDEGSTLEAAALDEEVATLVMTKNNATAGKQQVQQNRDFLKANPNWAPEDVNPALKKQAVTEGGEGAGDDDDFTPAAKDWISKHPRFNTDKKYKAAAVAAHTEYETLLADGEVTEPLDSPAYFKHIEDSLKQRGLEKARTQDPPPAPKRQPPQGYAAPPAGRGGTAAGGKTKVKVRLTAEEAEAARLSGYDTNNPADVQEYADNLAKQRSKK